MKKIIAFVITTLSLSVFAADVNITSWYRLNPRDGMDRAAEVCFNVVPAPSSHAIARITVDPDTRNAGRYNTFVGRDGQACQVVSTYRGIVRVEIPDMNIVSEKQI